MDFKPGDLLFSKKWTTVGEKYLLIIDIERERIQTVEYYSGGRESVWLTNKDGLNRSDYVFVTDFFRESAS